VPLTDDHRLDEAAFRTKVEEKITAEQAYLAALDEQTGAGTPRGLGESTSPGTAAAPDPATVTALEETYKSRGLSPEAARLAAAGRPL
jgi:hypothetical protein